MATRKSQSQRPAPSFCRIIPRGIAVSLLLTACATTPSPAEDPFAHWGAMPSMPGASGGPSSEEIHQNWLDSPADWRSFDAERFEAELATRLALWRLERRRHLPELSPTLAQGARARVVDAAAAEGLELPSHEAYDLKSFLIQSGLSETGLIAHELTLTIRGSTAQPASPRLTWSTVLESATAQLLSAPEIADTLSTRRPPELGLGAALGGDGSRLYVVGVLKAG